ncbi:hypothetical protein SAMN02910358_02303 [Lachnospiraceae bacterium XBB1006]|nr:hypothetical protein SAMN02910358_02303 [Lachnospiraceae bacterium XBB1006]
MFREMRRKKQLLSKEDTEIVLMRNSVGVLSVLGDDGYPYGVPISYVYHDGKIIVHCAKEGHKMDAIRALDKVSFTVVDKNEVREEEYTSYFRSVIAFGRIHEMVSDEEIEEALYVLSEKYSPSISKEKVRAHAKDGVKRTAVLVMEIEHVTGKEAIELVNAKHHGEGAL